MKYFTCTKVDYPPYLKFDCCSRDTDELLKRGLGVLQRGELTLQKGVFQENEIPPLENDIYPVDYHECCLIPRDKQQLKAAKQAFEEKVRLRYVASCDKKVSACIEAGFEFDGFRFSLSANAQLNWLRVGVSLSLGVLKDTPIPTLDDSLYVLTTPKAAAFFAAFCSKIDDCLLDNEKF